LNRNGIGFASAGEELEVLDADAVVASPGGTFWDAQPPTAPIADSSQAINARKYWVGFMDIRFGLN
jgi:hypothetical protein